jgi:hypothetical protein
MGEPHYASRVIADIAAVATAIGVFIALTGLRQNQRQRIRAFEDFYVRRYWELMDQLSLDALRGKANGPLSEADEKIIRAYLLFCEDELDLRAIGWISDATWKIWGPGILTQLHRWPFDEVWNDVKQTGTHDRLHQHTQAGGTGDPYGTGHWWERRVRALRGWLHE